MTLATPPFRRFLQGHVGIVHWSTHVRFAVRILALTEILAFNAQNLRGHVTLVTTPFTPF